MATNTGLFRIPEGASKPERVVGQLETPDGSGEVSEALVVRFDGPDTLIGSGHPAAGSSLPQALGLIRSEDAGKTWTSVSELGNGRLPRDRAGRRRHRRGAVPAAAGARVGRRRARRGRRARRRCRWSALEVEPRRSAAVDRQHRARHLRLGATPVRAGASATRRPTSRFAWADDGTLYRIDPGGPVKVSTDGGQKWEDRGSTGGEPQAMTVDEDGKLYVALIDGTLKVSDDGGETFTDQVRGG